MSAPATRAETDGGGLAGTVGHQIAEPPAYLEVEVIEDAHLTALLWRARLTMASTLIVNSFPTLSASSVPLILSPFCNVISVQDSVNGRACLPRELLAEERRRIEL